MDWARKAARSGRLRSRLASDTSMPPYRVHQLYRVVSLIPCWRHRSAGFAPALCSRRISMIFSSLKRFRFMAVLLERTQPYYVRVSGVHVTSLMVRFMRSTCPLVQGCLGLVGR